MNKAVITIPDGITGMDITTNGVHPVVMVNALNMATRHFARELVAMARQAVGDDPAAQAQWLERITKKYLGDNEDNGKTFGLDDILGLN